MSRCVNKPWSTCPRSLSCSFSPSLFVCISVSVSLMITTQTTLFSFSLSLSLLRFHFFPSPYLPPLSPFLLSLPPDFRWVHCLPERLTTHPQFSLIELRSLRTSALRFNLFWPERGACTPSLYHYIRGMVRRHRGGRGGRSDPERNHPNAPQHRASNRIQGYGNGVKGWLRFH